MRLSSSKRDLGLVAVTAVVTGVVLHARPAASQDAAELAERVTALEAELERLKTSTASELEAVRDEVQRVESSLGPTVEALETSVAKLMDLTFRPSGADLVLEHAGSEIRLTEGGITLRGSSQVRVEAGDVDVVGGRTVDVRAPDATLLGSTTAELSGASTRISASTRVRVVGPITQIGNGQRQVARVGDSVQNGRIVSGSSQILCP
jgi:hypothetical protein